jgi:hypothetical protein
VEPWWHRRQTCLSSAGVLSRRVYQARFESLPPAQIDGGSEPAFSAGPTQGGYCLRLRHSEPKNLWNNRLRLEFWRPI